jgi:predicted O-methyltransferase YrrM
MIRTAHENGHFYSPVVDPAELALRSDELWPAGIPECPGVDFNDAQIQTVLREWFPRFMPDFDYPEQPGADESKFFIQNSQFSWLDCRTLFVLLRQLKPKRLIEIGSGFSSLLSADVNQRFFTGAMEFTCVEPFPRPFLVAGVPGITRLEVRKAQQLEPEWFDQLQPGDILFIDSSHVCKTGSDVNHLYLKVLPRLRPGVIVHIHDIFLPGEYLKSWVLDENRSWNEQYLVQVMLQHSQRYRVLFANYYAFLRYPELVVHALATGKGHGYGGGSLWLQIRD